MAFGSGTTLFKPGEVVPSGGIYRVLHKGHRDTHEVSLNAYEVFPVCRECGSHVRFELLLPLWPYDGLEDG
jgi:hypothetical protein